MDKTRSIKLKKSKQIVKGIAPQKTSTIQQALHIRKLLEMDFYRDPEEKKYCPDCCEYYDKTFEECPCCSQLDKKAEETYEAEELSDSLIFEDSEIDEAADDYHGKLEEADLFHIQKAPPKNIKKLLKDELKRSLNKDDTIDDVINKKFFRDFCFKIIDRLKFSNFSKHIFLLFEYEMVNEIKKIKKLIKGKEKNISFTSRTGISKDTYPLVTRELLLSCLSRPKNCPDIFPSLYEIRNIRIILEPDSEKTLSGLKEIINRLDSTLNRLKNPEENKSLMRELKTDRAFQEFKREFLEKKLNKYTGEISDILRDNRLKPSDKERINIILDLLIKSIDKLSRYSRSAKDLNLYGERISKKNTLFRYILYDKKTKDGEYIIKETYEKIKDKLKKMKSIGILFNNNIKSLWENLSIIIKKEKFYEGENEEERIAQTLKEHYFSCLSCDKISDHKAKEKALNLIKKSIKNIKKSQIRKSLKYKPEKPEGLPGIIIREIEDKLYAQIPSYLPLNLELNENLTGQNRKDAKAYLKDYITNCSNLDTIGNYLIREYTSALKSKNINEMKSEIYKNFKFQDTIAKETGISEEDISKHFSTENLKLPSGSIIQLKEFRPIKKDILDENYNKFSRYINVEKLTDTNAAKKLNEYFKFPCKIFTGKDIKDLRERKNIPKKRGRKKSKES